MKKIIGVLGVAMMAAIMFFTNNNLNEHTSDVSLASLISVTKANAESDGGTGGGIFGVEETETCSYVDIVYGWDPIYQTTYIISSSQKNGSKINCKGFWGWCVASFCG